MAEDEAGTIKGATLNIGTSLTLDYYATFTGEAEGASMRFTSSSGRITEVEGVFDEGKNSFRTELDALKFDEIDAFISGCEDKGMFWIYSRVADGVSIKDAEEAIWHELDLLKTELVPDEELEKVRAAKQESLKEQEAERERIQKLEKEQKSDENAENAVFGFR